MRFSHTVAFRLFLLIASIATVILFVLTLIAIHIQKSHLMDNVLLDADRLSDVIARSTRHSMLLNRKEDVQNIVASIGREPGIEGIRIYNKMGDVVFATIPADLHSRVDAGAEACAVCHPSGRLADAHPLDNARSRIFRNQGGERILGLITPIRNEAECSNAACHAHPSSKTILGVLDVKMSLVQVDERLSESTTQLISLAVASALVISIVSGVFFRVVIHKPVHVLMSGMKHVADGHLDHRIGMSKKDELGQLAAQFNTMTTELARARAEITSWSDTLEQKVREKTDQLEMAHRQMLHVEKMASLGNLAASVAHELNNPLEGILTFAKLLSKQVRKSPLPPEQIRSFTDDLTLVAEESERCGTIVKNLLLFARKGSEQFERIAVQEVIDRCIALTSHHARVHNVRVEVLRAGTIVIECNRNEIEQVVIATVMNAIEAMSGPGQEEAGGTLTVGASMSGDGHSAVLLIADTGIGMTDEIKAHIFEPFFSTKSHKKGVGLGLAITYGIVKRHHGTIVVDSAPGKGTRFRITLPLAQPADRQELEPSSLPESEKL